MEVNSTYSQIIKYLDKDTLKILAGKTIYYRGVEYYREGLVLKSQVQIDPLSLKGEVQGTYPIPYEVYINLVDKTTISSYCDCPYDGFCKHRVALALEVLDKYQLASRTELVSSKETFSWKNLINSKNDTPYEYTGLALVFSVNTKAMNPSRSFAYSNSSQSNNSTNQLMCKLALQGKRKKWIESGISWEEIRTLGTYYHTGKTVHIDRNALNIVRELLATHLSNAIYRWSDIPKWIDLNSISSQFLFELLQSAKNNGIDFIYNCAQELPVEIKQAPIIPSAEFSKESSEAIRLQFHLKHEGKALEANQFMIIGAAGTTAFHWEGDINSDGSFHSLCLSPIVPNLETKYHSPILGNMTIAIPKDEKHHFSQLEYPFLKDNFEIEIVDNAFAPPTISGPTLKIEVIQLKIDLILLNLSWLYKIDGEEFEFSLQASKDDFRTRDLFAEEKIMLRASSCLSRISIFEFGFENIDSVELSKIHCFDFMSMCLETLKSDPDILVTLLNEMVGYKFHESEPTVVVETQKPNSNDWLDINVSLQIDDLTIPYSELYPALINSEEFLFLDSGDIINLDHSSISNLRSLILEAQSLQDRKTTGISINRYNVGIFDELCKLGIVESQATHWINSAKNLLNIQDIPVASVPEAFNGTLRKYQMLGFNWLMFLTSNKFGAVLADDMGLGKTIQVIALLQAIKEAQKKKNSVSSLIICPTSVVFNWKNELEKFASNLSVLALTATISKSQINLAEAATNNDIIITTYGIIQRDEEIFETVNWSTVIIDEAQYIKNHNSKTFAAIKKIRAESKIALTGTPLENNLMELWSIYSVVAPGLFASQTKFRDEYQKPIESSSDKEQLDRLRRRIKPFILRRVKEQVLKDLPNRIDQVLQLDLLPAHQKIYDTYLSRERQKIMGLLDDFKKNRFTILKSLTTLRMLSLSASLIDSNKYSKVPSAKILALTEFLEEIFSENHKAVVFSQFTSFLAEVRKVLDKKHIKYSYLDGRTKKREEAVADFKSGKNQLFLISLKAGGVGLNLVEADYCFILDPWWNPAVEQQAVDRTHRIGQKNTVHVYRLLSNSTIEEKVLKLKEKKEKLFHSVLDEGEMFSKAITADDIKSLFV